MFIYTAQGREETFCQIIALKYISLPNKNHLIKVTQENFDKTQMLEKITFFRKIVFMVSKYIIHVLQIFVTSSLKREQ